MEQVLIAGLSWGLVLALLTDPVTGTVIVTARAVTDWS